jgi:mannose-6-phosphate isomerase-like protein (cupin superfamily)
MPSSFAVVNIAGEVERLVRPFQMLRLAQIDDMAVEVFLCQGAVSWHRHVNGDELFIAFSGLMTLESEWGTVTLRPWEIALVPKGVGHRSIAAFPSAVLLIRPVALQDRKNGNRRLYGLPREARLRKTSLVGSREWPGMPYRPQFLMQVEDRALRMLRCVGVGPWIEPRSADTLLLAQQGTLLLEGEEWYVPLMGGELVNVGKSQRHRLTSDTVSVVLELVRVQQEQSVASVATE